MDAATPARRFEGLFTTKADPGTGPGLATVSDIVTGNGGLIPCGSHIGPRRTRVRTACALASPGTSEFSKHRS